MKDLWKKLKYAARKVVSGLMKAKEFLFGSSDGAVGRATVEPRAYIYIHIIHVGMCMCVESIN